MTEQQLRWLSTVADMGKIFQDGECCCQCREGLWPSSKEPLAIFYNYHLYYCNMHLSIIKYPLTYYNTVQHTL